MSRPFTYLGMVAWLSLAFTLSHNAARATIVNSIVTNETWTASGGPYEITTNIQVLSLNIGPGTRILFHDNWEFKITGELLAIGDAANPISFEPVSNGVHGAGIVFSGANTNSRLEYAVVQGSIGSGVRIQGTPLTVRHCTFAYNWGPQGGGIYTDSFLALEDCTFTNNSAGATYSGGGGIRSDAALLRLTRCRFSANSVQSAGWPTSAFGGAVYGGNTVEMTDCEVTDNQSFAHGNDGAGYGGGIWVGGQLLATNCAVLRNYAGAWGDNHGPGGYGGGVYVTGPTVLIRCSVTDNSAYNVNSGASGGGGIYCQSLLARGATVMRNSTTANYAYVSAGGGIHASGTINLVNCLICENTLQGATWAKLGSAIRGGGANSVIENCTIARNTQNGEPTWWGAIDEYYGEVRNTIIYTNTLAFFNSSPTVSYSLIQGGYSGTGNLDTDPQFLNMTDYLLTDSSSPVDQGDPAAQFNDAFFPPSRGGVRNDMGAYGGPGGRGMLGYIQPLAIIAQPASLIVTEGSDASFSVGATGGGELRYQWKVWGTNILGATNSSMTLPNVALERAGIYTVEVSTTGDTLTSSPASLTVTRMKMYAGLTISGIVGAHYQIQYSTNPSSTNSWTTMTNIILQNSPALFIDYDSADSPGRFYRYVLIP